MLATIRNAEGEALDHAYTAAAAGRPTVVIGHGVTANKDRAWAVALDAALAGAGYGVLRLSFSGNGDSEGDFRDSTVTKEVADLGAALDALERAGVAPLVYAGHSMGGAVGVLRTASDARVRALVSLAGMVDTAGFARRKFGDLVPDRDTMWDKPDCPLSQAFVDDMQAIGTVLPHADAIDVPWLLVHGDADTVVPISDSRSIVERRAGVDPEPRLVTMPGGDHLFSDHENGMAAHVVRWLDGIALTPTR